MQLITIITDASHKSMYEVMINNKSYYITQQSWGEITIHGKVDDESDDVLMRLVLAYFNALRNYHIAFVADNKLTLNVNNLLLSEQTKAYYIEQIKQSILVATKGVLDIIKTMNVHISVPQSETLGRDLLTYAKAINHYNANYKQLLENAGNTDN